MRPRLEYDRSYVNGVRPCGNIHEVPGRRSAYDALATRSAILRRAAEVASVEGLEGISIGNLAADLGMSKSGVIGQFGSKEELQIATLALAADDFRQRVWEPAQHLAPGLPRLLGICAAWTSYAEEPSFSGGCFIAQVTYEYDSRDGRVHDELARIADRWRRTLVAEITVAIDAGELPGDTNAAQVAFSLEALASGMNPARYLHGDTAAGNWALQAMHAILGVPAPEPAPA
jgi:AcrR family transcriptional regulator